MSTPRSRRAWTAVLLVVSGLLVVAWVSVKDDPVETTPSATDVLFLERSSSPQMPPSMSLTERAAKYVRIDKAYLKWMWWPLLIYLFWGMAYVCDDFFVRTIEVISERFNIPDDVAGATLMALGCNGPEMALNTIAIFQPSDIGVGAVVGGEVFNVLVIIGTAMLATPDTYLPLRISRCSFFRDVFFYMVSVFMLYLILKDGYISRHESLALLGGAVVYSSAVATTSRVREAVYRFKRYIMGRYRPHHEAADKDPLRMSTGTLFNPEPHSPERKTLRGTTDLRRSASAIHETLNGPRCSRTLSDMPGSPTTPFSAWGEDSDDSDIENDADPELINTWNAAKEGQDPRIGSVIGVRVEVRSRMMDRRNQPEERYMWLTDNAIMVSAAVGPDVPKAEKGRGGEMVFDISSRWHYGGLVNAPDIRDGEKIVDPRSPSGAAARESNQGLLLRTVSKVPSTAGILGLHEVPCEAIPFKNVLYCDPVMGDPKMFTLHVHQGDGLGLGRLITLEFLTSGPAVHDAWTSALRDVLQNQPTRFVDTADHPPEDETYTGQLLEMVAWFQFPVKFFAKMTIPDMDRPDRQHLYPLAFVMSMFWLAVFAYLVVSACLGIHEDFGIPTGLLGFTIAAAGTSFPNVFAGMVVSRQGKTTMAVANALGANVQNVFLALAVPWTIQSWFVNHGSFPMPVQGLEAQIAAIYITLLPLVLIFVCSKYSLPGWSGWVFLATYLIYLTNALGAQSTGCLTWPFNC